jgi:hypothetical protein
MVPYLAEEDGPFRVHSVNHWLPCLNLLLAPQARHVWVTPRGLGHGVGLRNEEDALRRPLLVIQNVVRLGKAPVRPAPAQWR